MGPVSAAAKSILELKYCQPGEDFREVCNRVAGALTDSDEHYHEFRDALRNMRFIPGGRILSSIGTTKNTTAYNCFVSGTIEDSFVDGEGSIMQRAAEAAATMRLGGGIGYDFSTLRPRGAAIKKLGSNSTGPISFMEIFNAVCNCVASSGHRRGAQMAVLRCDHPDIEEFINAKQSRNRLTGFNLSIAVTDRFMKAVRDRVMFQLQWNGQLYQQIDARTLWDKIMRSTWDWGEPGVLFIDRINEQNNLAYCETIAATNPCAEQPLPPFGACLLGSFNLVQYLELVQNIPRRFGFDWARLRADIPAVVSAMDRVIDCTSYPLPQQRQEALQKRRMGLGVMGVANAGEVLGFPYGSKEFLDWLDEVLVTIKNEAYIASAALAAQRGSFPLFEAKEYLERPFIQGLQPHVQAAIGRHGLRNSHLTSIAPTGTISMMADNVSSGIEPVYAYKAMRRVETPAGPVEMEVQDYAMMQYGVHGRLASEVTAEEHIAVLLCCQPHIDSSISKTCNVSPSMAWEDFKQLYMAAWQGGAKGCTTFQTNGGKRGSIMTAMPATGSCTAEACTG